MNGESSNEAQRDSLKVAVLDEFVEVETEQFKCDAEMVSEHNVVFYSHNVVLIIRVIHLQVLQDLHFYLSLVLEFLLVSDDLESDELFVFMIKHLDGLPKRALAKELLHLIPVAYVVVILHKEVALVVVVPIVKGIARGTLYFCRASFAHTPDLFVVKNLSLLKVSENASERLDGFAWFERPLDLWRLTHLRGSSS